MCKDYNKAKIFPNNQFVYELWAANEGHVSHWKHEQTNRQNRVSITFCHFAEISVVRNQLNFNTVEKFVITLTGVISELNQMVPAK